MTCVADTYDQKKRLDESTRQIMINEKEHQDDYGHQVNDEINKHRKDYLGDEDENHQRNNDDNDDNYAYNDESQNIDDHRHNNHNNNNNSHEDENRIKNERNNPYSNSSHRPITLEEIHDSNNKKELVMSKSNKFSSSSSTCGNGTSTTANESNNGENRWKSLLKESDHCKAISPLELRRNHQRVTDDEEDEEEEEDALNDSINQDDEDKEHMLSFKAKLSAFESLSKLEQAAAAEKKRLDKPLLKSSSQSLSSINANSGSSKIQDSQYTGSEQRMVAAGSDGERQHLSVRRSSSSSSTSCSRRGRTL